MFFIVKIPDSTNNDEVLTAIRTSAGSSIIDANLEVGDAVAREESRKKEDAKDQVNA
jgi:hypothetical protein